MPPIWGVRAFVEFELMIECPGCAERLISDQGPGAKIELISPEGMKLQASLKSVVTDDTILLQGLTFAHCAEHEYPY